MNLNHLIPGLFHGLQHARPEAMEILPLLAPVTHEALRICRASGFREKNHMLSNASRHLIKVLNLEIPVLSIHLAEADWLEGSARGYFEEAANCQRAGMALKLKASNSQMEAEGPALWELLHHFAAEGEATHRQEFLAGFGSKIPCGRCRSFWKWHLENEPPPEGRDAFFVWTVALHNKVNVKLGKPDFPESEARQRFGVERPPQEEQSIYPIVIPLHRKGGKLRNNHELRYLLRAVETHFKDSFEIIIASAELPDWLTGVRHLKLEEDTLKGAWRLAADSYPGGFFWMSDDVCLLKDTTASQMKITPAKASWGSLGSWWGKRLEEIRLRLIEEGVEPIDYSNPHGPYWFTKEMVDDYFATFPARKGKHPGETYVLSRAKWPWREGVVRQYCHQAFTPPPESAWFLNYSNKGNTPALRAWLQSRFPGPSAFEKSSQSSQKQKLMFIHVPKTGGTSIRQALSFKLMAGGTSHYRSDHPKILAAITPETRLFAVVRNPYDRAWSAFKFFAKAKEKRGRNERIFEIFMRGMDANDFWCNMDIARLSQFMPHVRTQSSFIRHEMTLLRFENLEEDWAQFMAEVSREAVKLPLLQDSPGVPWQEALSASAQKRIREIYQEDFIRFGYD